MIVKKKKKERKKRVFDCLKTDILLSPNHSSTADMQMTKLNKEGPDLEIARLVAHRCSGGTRRVLNKTCTHAQLVDLWQTWEHTMAP